jgi:hypothetical protein
MKGLLYAVLQKQKGTSSFFITRRYHNDYHYNNDDNDDNDNHDDDHGGNCSSGSLVNWCKWCSSYAGGDEDGEDAAS